MRSNNLNLKILNNIFIVTFTSFAIPISRKGHNMKISFHPISQLRSMWHIVLFVLTVSAAFIGVVILLHYWKGIPFGNLTREPISVIMAPLYTGFLSQIGNLFWAASAAFCFFGATILKHYPNSQNLKHFLFFSAFLTIVLCLDDVFLLHEDFFPYYIGISENLVYICYFIVISLYLIIYKNIILKTEYILLAIAFLFFGASIILNIFTINLSDPYLIEDGLKFVGIVSWLVYFFRLGIAAVSLKLVF